MRKNLISLIVKFSPAVLFLCLFTAGVHSAGKKTLIIGWESFEPFAYRDSSNNITGLDIELITGIMKSQGYAIEYSESPWARILKWIEDGKIHIGPSSTKTPEREEYAYFSEPYYKETFVLFVRKGESSRYKIRSLEDISGSTFRLGVLRDSIYGRTFSRLMKEPEFIKNVEPVPTDKQNYMKLSAKRIDGFIHEYSRMATYGKKYGIFNKVEPLLIVGESYQYVMFSKKGTTPETVEDFNKGLKVIQREGTYLRIFRKYNMEKFNMLNQ